MFLGISYYLDVIRLSVPLIIIYFIFCFNYIINHDQNQRVASPVYNENIDNQIEIDSSNKLLQNNIQNIDNEKTINTVPRPIVSYNPRPIIIDSNIIINKDIENNFSSIKKAKKDSINNLLNKNINDLNLSNNLKLNEIMVCRGIYKRNPIKPGYNFINNVDSLFCYTKISNSGPKQEIKHIWFYNDKEISSVVYNIKTSFNYRSWSRKTILPNQIGNWRVEVVDQSGNVLGTREFSIKSINNIY